MHIPLDFIVSKVKQSESYVLGFVEIGGGLNTVHARIAFGIAEALAKRTKHRTLLIEIVNTPQEQWDSDRGNISGMLLYDHVQWYAGGDSKEQKHLWARQLESFTEWKSEYGLIVIRMGCMHPQIPQRATKLCDGLSLLFESHSHLRQIKSRVVQWQRDGTPILGAWSYRTDVSVAA